MLNGFRRGTSSGRPLANLFSFGEGAARIRAEQRKAALRRSSILSSRLSVEAQKTPQPSINVRGDRTTKYRTVAEVVRIAQAQGMRRVGFVAENERN